MKPPAQTLRDIGLISPRQLAERRVAIRLLLRQTRDRLRFCILLT